MWADSIFDKNQQIIQLEEDELNFLNEFNDNSLFKFDQQISCPLFLDELDNQNVCIIKENEEGQDKLQDRESMQINYLDIEEVSIINNVNEIQHKRSVKLNQMFLRKSFFANLLRVYFEQAIKKYPANYQIRLQYAYFALVHMRSIFQCVNILRDLDYNKLSWHDQVNLKVNEITFIRELEIHLKRLTQFQNGFNPKALGMIDQINKKSKIQRNVYDQNINPEHFINLAHLYDQFNRTSQILNQNIMEFWSLVIDKNFNLNTLLKSQKELSNTISYICRVFNKIESSCKEKDAKIYYFFGLIQKQLLNDEKSYDIMIQKSKNIRNMQRVLKVNYQNTVPDNDVGIITCMGGIKNFGKLLLCNQKVKMLTGFDSTDLKHQSIEIFMPSLIREFHKGFMIEFSKTGQTNIINKVINTFIMKKNGTVQLVNFQVKYHYSQNYDHCFVAFVKKIDELQLWNNSSNQKNIEKVMFVLSDNIDGKIVAFSDNCKKYLGFKTQFLNAQEVISKSNNFTLCDICPILDISILGMKQKSMINDDQKNCRVFEGCFDYQTNYLPNQIIKERKLSQFRNRPMKFKIIKECYFGQKLEMNILAMEFVEKIQTDYSNQIISVDDILFHTNGEDKNQQELEDNEDLSSSMSSDTHKNNDEIKSQFIRDDQKSPRLLRIAVQLIILIFIAMIVLSSVNYYLAQTRNQSLESEILILNDSYQRITLTLKCKVYLQQMILMANGYESQSSSIQPLKYESIRFLLFQSQEELRLIQSHLEHEGFDYSNEFSNLLNDQLLQMEYLNEDSSITLKNTTVTFGVNIFVARLLDIYNMNKNQLIGNLSIQTLKPAKLPYSASLVERTIFFISQNSIKSMRKMNQLLTDMYIKEIQDHSDSSKFQVEISLIGSICAIVIVGIIVIPILTKIQDKQFIAIQFFFKIPRDKVMNLQTQVNDFSEKLGIHVQNEVIPINDEIELYPTIDQSKFMEQSKFIEPIDNTSMKQTTLFSNGDRSYFTNFNSHNLSINTVNDNSYLVINENQLKSDQLKEEQIIQEHKISNFNKIYLNQTDKFLMKGIIGSSRISDADDDLSRGISEDNIIKQKEQIEIKVEEDDELQNLEDMKITQIKSSKLKKKLKVLMICIFFITTCSLYFVGTYLMSLRTYNSISQVVNSLRLILAKNYCPETVFALTRESQIKNTTALFGLDDITIITDQMNKCYGLEQEYGQFRKDIPEALKATESFINSIEGDELCTVTYVDSDKLARCQQANNGILSKGLSNAAQYMLQHFQQQNLKMVEKSRDLSYLNKLLLNNLTSELIMMKTFIIEDTLKILYQKSIESASVYFYSLLKQYMIVFVLFLSFQLLMVTIFVTKVFKAMKLYLWQTNMSLKILPLQYLPEEEIKQLKRFFSNQ